MEQAPEQIQWISNLAHWIEGGIFGIVAAIALAEALGYSKSKAARYVWPGLILAAGIFLPVYILLQGGLAEIGVTWNFVIRDPQQREHFLMAVLLLVAGTAEILHRADGPRTKLWGLVAPGAFVTIGIVLFIHTEYGTPEAIAESVVEHRYQGSAIILAGALKGAAVLWHQRFKWLAFPWIAFLFVAALFLVTYREPEGAYRMEQPGARTYSLKQSLATLRNL